jgi:O-antigen ligase
VLLIFLIISKKIKKFSIILILFTLYFIFQFIGLLANDTRVTDIHSAYLILYAMSIISILAIIDIEKLHKIIPYFFYIALSILTIAYLIILSQSTDNLSILFRGNFYRLLPGDEEVFFQAFPKVTGITRSFGIISLSLLVIFTYNKKKKILSPIIFLSIMFLSIIIWLAQSRGSILCYYFSSIFFIIFLNNLNQFKKFLMIISITFFSIVVSNVIINVVKKDILETKKIDEKISSNKKHLPRIFEMEAGTSGRLTLWNNALDKYEKNKLFGYGPQADRILINKNNVYGNNVSNALIYALLSGGYFSLIILILIYLYTAYMFLKFFLVNKIFSNQLEINKENIFVVTSLVYTVFFMIRSIFENSFGVFSIDFLILILSLFVIENQISKKLYLKSFRSYL